MPFSPAISAAASDSFSPAKSAVTPLPKIGSPLPRQSENAGQAACVRLSVKMRSIFSNLSAALSKGSRVASSRKYPFGETTDTAHAPDARKRALSFPCVSRENPCASLLTTATRIPRLDKRAVSFSRNVVFPVPATGATTAICGTFRPSFAARPLARR